MYRLDEGVRGARAVRPQNRGLAYWTDGEGDNRILLISPGYQLVAINADNGRAIKSFGTKGIVDLTNSEQFSYAFTSGGGSNATTVALTVTATGLSGTKMDGVSVAITIPNINSNGQAPAVSGL